MLGSFALGWSVGSQAAGVPWVAQVVGTGFCGGFTTFSTAMVEVVRLAAVRRRWIGIFYAAGTLTAAVLAAALGVVAATAW